MRIGRFLGMMLCLAALVACAPLSGATNTEPTPTVLPLFATLTAQPDIRTPLATPTPLRPPSVATFCPSSQTLAPIVGYPIPPDETTGTVATTTTCGYFGGGYSAEFDVTVFLSVQESQDYYLRIKQSTQQVGTVQDIQGIGDAAYYFVGEAIYLQKGPYNLLVKCYLPNGANEQIDIQLAKLLASKL